MDAELCPRELMKRSEFYNDYLRPVGCSQSLAGVVRRDQDTALMLTALRQDRREPWGEANRRLVEFLLPHLTRANAVQERLALLEVGESLLDIIPIGVLMLSDDGKALYLNQTAEAIVRQDDGLTLRAGRPCVNDTKVGGALRRAVDLATSLGTTLECSEAVLVERKSMLRPYHLVVAPICRRLPAFVGTRLPVAMILITDPEQHHPASAELFRKLYGLTKKEAQVANLLCEAKSLEETADALEMTYETARTHLRRIFSKTGTSRQAELVTLLVKLPPTMFKSQNA